MFVIPDSWCTPFHKISGTSGLFSLNNVFSHIFLIIGPYVFFGSLATFLVSKEIYVLEENAMKLCGFIAIYLFISRSVQCKFW